MCSGTSELGSPRAVAGAGASLLDAGLEALAAVDLDGVPPAALGAELVALTRMVARLEAQWLRRLECFDRSGGAAANGSASTAAWLRHACHLAPGDASTRVRCARQLKDSLPITAATLADGDISYRHAAVLSRAITDIPPQAVAEAEPTLVDAARQLNPSALHTVATHWRHVIDADPSGHDEESTAQRRYLSISTTLRGTVVLDAELCPEDGATLLTAIGALSAPLPQDDRTPRQRRADALVELARRSLDAGTLPDTGGVRPHLTVILNLDTLRQEAGAPAATTDWAGPISARTARRLACDAAVTRVLTSGPSQVLDVGRATRTIPPGLRTALNIRDRGCTHPTCDRPTSWCEAHHIIHWADGGETKLTNLTLLCRYHHRLAHQGEWRIPHPRQTPPSTPPVKSEPESVP